MAIKVKFFSTLRLELNKSVIEYEIEDRINVAKIIDMLDKDFQGRISEKLIEGERIKPGTIILVNGKNVLHLVGLNTTVKDGDELSIFPPSGGG